jgi:hypothetical protein
MVALTTFLARAGAAAAFLPFLANFAAPCAMMINNESLVADWC